MRDEKLSETVVPLQPIEPEGSKPKDQSVAMGLGLTIYPKLGLVRGFSPFQFIILFYKRRRPWASWQFALWLSPLVASPGQPQP